MQLPNLPQDKANHAFWGAVLACATSLVSVELAVVAVASAAALKELSDALINYRATGNPMQGPHGVELLDALATAAGGALVIIPQIL